VNDGIVAIFLCSVAVVACVAIWLWEVSHGVNGSGGEVLEKAFCWR